MTTNSDSDHGPARSPWIADLRWARKVQQDRSRQTQAALLNAVEAELKVSTVEAISVSKIAERARVSVGSVYFHFENKQALVHAMIDRWADEFIATTDDATDPERFTGASLLDVLQAFAEYSLLQTNGTKGLIRARTRLALEDPEVAAQVEKAASYMVQRVFDLLWARRDEIGRDDPAEALYYVIYQIRSMVRMRADLPGTRITAGVQSDAAFIRTTIDSARTILEIKTSGSTQLSTNKASTKEIQNACN